MGRKGKFMSSVAWRCGGDMKGKTVLTVAIFTAVSLQNMSITQGPFWIADVNVVVEVF